MKKIFALFFISFGAYAQCPDLQGDYHCVFERNEYSRLRVTQEQVSKEITLYGFKYLSINTDPDYVPASQYGESDDMGWITKCKDGKLLSIPGNGGNSLSEIYLDKKNAFTRKFNGNIVQSCPRAQ